MLNKSWSNLLISGVLMTCLSVVIFGGLIHLFITNPESWLYIGFLLVSGFSTFVSSILMLYDSLKLKLKKELKKNKKKQNARTEEIKDHIKILSEEADRIKPESMR